MCQPAHCSAALSLQLLHAHLVQRLLSRLLRDSGPRCSTRMLYEWFEENGGLTRENGDRFRDDLSRGNTEDLAAMYRAFRGRDPRIEPMLAERGLLAAEPQ